MLSFKKKARKTNRQKKAKCFIEDIESGELFVWVDVIMHPVTRFLHRIPFTLFKEFKGEYIPVDIAGEYVARGLCHVGQQAKLSNLLKEAMENR